MGTGQECGEGTEEEQGTGGGRLAKMRIWTDQTGALPLLLLTLLQLLHAPAAGTIMSDGDGEDDDDDDDDEDDNDDDDNDDDDDDGDDDDDDDDDDDYDEEDDDDDDDHYDYD